VGGTIKLLRDFFPYYDACVKGADGEIIDYIGIVGECLYTVSSYSLSK
jgi:hypothetical protein